MPVPERVCAVVVTYNRREMLVECLRALQAQSRAPDRILVVDNASTDGTPKLVRSDFPDVDLLALEENVGGAGGFYEGMRAAHADGADWLWLMDDDTIPTPTALEALLAAISRHRDVALAGSRVVWTDGADHPMNTPRAKPFAGRLEQRAARGAGGIAVRSSSFVSMLVAAERVRATGLPVADYFIWNDDFEYSTRLLRRGRGLFVKGSVVVHKTKARADTDSDPGARFFYEVRNKVWLLAFSRGLGPAEKVMYTGATLRRWWRTFRRSQNRRFLLLQLWRGLVAGFGSRPRPNAVVLGGFGEVTQDVERVDAAAGRSR
jgi:rhamnopyranosyl-N-acetylglucosaminyl-diphospho-decaprenol beta-1,3/1,4-galactofuranosyltransferase